LDQADDSTFDELPASVVADLRANYVRTAGGPPAEDARPTSEQISALNARLKAGKSPFVDFAVWGAFGRRAAKLLKFTTQVFVEGSLQTRLLRGPGSFEAWRAAWRVLRSCLIMLEAASPAALDAYEEGIRQLTVLFPGSWGTVSVADEAMRAEQWDVLLEQFSHSRPEGFDADLPWNYILHASAYGSALTFKAHWWESRVVLPMLQNVSSARAAATAAVLEGSMPHAALQPDGGNKRVRTRAGKQSRTTAASSGAAASGATKQVCWAWNRDAAGCSSPCPSGRVHACEFCGLANHRGVACRKKGDGKGKGKGKGKPTF